MGHILDAFILRIERSGFEPWPGTLCSVLEHDTYLSQCLSPPRCIHGYAVGHPCDGLTCHRGRVELLLVVYATETAISSSLMGQLARMQTLTILPYSANLFMMAPAFSFKLKLLSSLVPRRTRLIRYSWRTRSQTIHGEADFLFGPSPPELTA